MPFLIQDRVHSFEKFAEALVAATIMAAKIGVVVVFKNPTTRFDFAFLGIAA
ncbi:hypothetical protein SmphiM12_502 [Sinorhizobium phage phiM12]|uniref:Uncharacterized protein n=1 Tax=Sinorhizobium phage phiM12 TaxID=1357423 RepID=A0A068NXM9_9CAUD|nr:hypothetical protein AB690_gp163 [Sinorhizobium phage phiM12]AIF27788.1 hypothetical protein SmphiM12_502 [Sinorhizobium phage phiM12]